jgi:hypothetical protein
LSTDFVSIQLQVSFVKISHPVEKRDPVKRNWWIYPLNGTTFGISGYRLSPVWSWQGRQISGTFQEVVNLLIVTFTHLGTYQVRAVFYFYQFGARDIFSQCFR